MTLDSLLRNVFPPSRTYPPEDRAAGTSAEHLSTNARAPRPVPLVAFLIGVLLCFARSLHVNAGTVTDWNTIATDQSAAFQNPATQTHTLAIVHIAIHDALNAITPRYEPYRYQDSVPEASPSAAVAAAARDTLVRLVPEAAVTVDNTYSEELARLPEGPAKTSGIAVGQAAAATILDARHNDDLTAATFKPYLPRSHEAGVYQATPPLNIVILAGWGELSRFSPIEMDQFRSQGPYALSSFKYARDYLEVKAFGSVDSTWRTVEQTETAKFWYDVATKEWHRIAQSTLVEVAADEWRAARLLALLSIAMADGTMASMDTKFAYDFWRPITAIRAGNFDGNRFTRGDSDWEPLCITPPFPEHNSTHAVTGAAAATVLASEFGDGHQFVMHSPIGTSRSYHRFSEAAYEEAVSRIYCGIHFRNGMNAGLAQGRAVARYIIAHLLRSREVASLYLLQGS